MNKTKKDSDIKDLHTSFASIFMGDNLGENAWGYNSDPKFWNDFNQKILDVQNYLIDNTKDSNRNKVDALVARLAILNHLSDKMGALRYGQFEKESFQPVDFENDLDEDIETRESKLADEIVEDYNRLIYSGNGTNFREEFNQFLDSIDYETIGSDGYNKLMDLVNATETVEYQFSANKLGTIQDEVSELKDDISNSPFGENDPDIQELAQFCKDNGFENIEQVQSFMYYHEGTIAEREKNVGDKIRLTEEKEILANEINSLKAEKEQVVQQRKSLQKSGVNTFSLRTEKMMIEGELPEVQKLGRIAKEGPKIVSDWIKVRQAEGTLLPVKKKDEELTQLMESIPKKSEREQKRFDDYKLFNAQEQKALKEGNLEEAAKFKEQKDFAFKNLNEPGSKLAKTIKEFEENQKLLNEYQAEFDKYNTKDKSGKFLSEYSMEEIDTVRETTEQAERKYNAKIQEFAKRLQRDFGEKYTDLDKLLNDAEKSISEGEDIDRSRETYDKFVNLYKKEDELTSNIEKLEKVTDEDIIKIKKDDLEKEKKEFARIKPVMDKVTAKQKTLNSSIDKANNSIDANLSDAKEIVNPQAKQTDAAFKSIAAHLDDKKGFFHRDSKEFTDMKNDLAALNNEKDPAKRTEIMKKLQKSSQDYIDAKTNNGKDMKRSTSMGKARQNYAEQINKMCKETLEKNSLWEEKTMKTDNSPIQKLGELDFQKVVNKELGKLGVEAKKPEPISFSSKLKEKAISNELEANKNEMNIGGK